MAADVARFSAAVDKLSKSFSTQEELRGLSERERRAQQQAEQQFQRQLRRAQAAFLQEFRNHSVVVENEVRKIREELTTKLEQQYGEKIALLEGQLEEEQKLSQKYKVEISKLKSMATAQEAYTTAMRHRLGLDKKEELRSRILELQENLVAAKAEGRELTQQLAQRSELVTQLRADLSALREEVRQQAASFVEERRCGEEQLQRLRQEMQQQQEYSEARIREQEEKFNEFREKTTKELQLQEILNERRSEALRLMEEERQRHLQARQKPTPRIIGCATAGLSEEETQRSRGLTASETAQQLLEAYNLSKTQRYRVDDMGMDTSWRDYQPSDSPLASFTTSRKSQAPKFRVERSHRGSSSLGPNPPMATGHLRPLQPPRASPRIPLSLGVSSVLGPRHSPV